MRRRRVCLGLPAFAVAIVMAGGCTRAIAPLVTPGESAVALTGGPNTSMIYVARTSAGVVAIDLGWWGHCGPFDAALRTLDATPADVAMVFLTHSHRDHLAAWPALRHARFHLAAPELPRLVGDSAHEAWIPRWADRIKRIRLPRAGELAVTSFSSDTTFVIGADTLRAYLVAGHTAGTAVYLFRGILFLGDAVTWSWWGGFASAKRGYSDDATAAAANLERLWPRLPSGGVRYVCTAHARCAPYSPQFVSSVSGRSGGAP